MKIKFKILLVILIMTFINTFVCPFSNADTMENTNIKSTIQNQISDLSLYSEAGILMDSKTGKMLYGKNENQKMYPASTTKILTAIIALENCNLTDKATASYNAIMSIPSGYSNAAIQENEVLSIQELLELFLIHSANEAGYILAEHISGSIENFADLMNQKAIEIGCTNTHFTNPSGIHNENHYSTAYDMALIAKYCMQNDTFRNIVSKPSCRITATDKYQERYFVNTNDLLIKSSKYYYEYAIGVKTGYTSQAKNCLIAASLKDNLELITVVLGAQTIETNKSCRYIDTINLFEYGFTNYKAQEITTKNSVIDEITIPNATKDTEILPLLIKDSIIGITPSALDLNNINYSIELNENLSAPISEGTVIGKISYDIDGIIYSSDLIASHSVEKSNLILLVGQIALIIIILFIVTKLLSKKNKCCKKKRKV